MGSFSTCLSLRVTNLRDSHLLCHRNSPNDPLPHDISTNQVSCRYPRATVSSSRVQNPIRQGQNSHDTQDGTGIIWRYIISHHTLRPQLQAGKLTHIPSGDRHNSGKVVEYERDHREHDGQRVAEQANRGRKPKLATGEDLLHMGAALGPVGDHERRGKGEADLLQDEPVATRELNAVDEPRKTKPRTNTTAQLTKRALTGTP